MKKLLRVLYTIFILLIGSTVASAASMNGFVLDGALIPETEIFSGGPPKDDIPSLDHPKFAKAAQAHFLCDEDQVLALKRNGIAKAYPFVELAKGSGEISDILAGKNIHVRDSHNHKSAEVFDAKGNALPSITLSWFAWYAFHPQTEIYRAK